MNARVQLGWVDPAELEAAAGEGSEETDENDGATDGATEGDSAEAAGNQA